MLLTAPGVAVGTVIFSHCSDTKLAWALSPLCAQLAHEDS